MMTKIIVLITTVFLLVMTIPAFAYADDSFSWGYYTYSFPEKYGYVAKDNLNAEGPSGVINLVCLDLGSLGLSISSDILGEQDTLQLLLDSFFSEYEWSIFENGERNNAAYIIGSVTMQSDGSSATYSTFGLLKKNRLLWGNVFDSSLPRSRSVATSFIEGVIVSDEIIDSNSSPSFYWELSKESTYTNVQFEAYSRMIKVLIPNNYEIYMPGMRDDSILPKSLGFTADEMEDYFNSLNNSGVYIFGFDINNFAAIRVTVNDIGNNLGELTDSGEYDEATIKTYYDGIALSQGSYEEKTIANRKYFVFPNYSNG